MLEVRKPFLPSFEEEEEEEDLKKIKENEEEEKPVEASSETTEETHGGEESTDSIQDSENPSSENENEKESSSSESEQQSSSENESGSETAENESENEQQAENEDQSSSSEETENENAAENESEEQTENPAEAENEQQTESEQQSSSNESEADEDQQNSSENESGSETSETENPAETESEESNESEEQTESEADENNEDASEGDQDYDEYEDQDGQAYSYNYNTGEVVDINANEKRMSAKYFATEFWRFIESFAEEKTKIYINTEAEEYNVKKLMFRAYEKKPLNAYMQKRVRETVILILDNSGSMSWWANNLRMLASLALEKKDVEIYIAPNGEITAQLTKNGRISVSHDKFMKISGRKVIYVGDFDGADTPIELSWRNDVVWICPEDRYRRFLSHNWVNYDESRFHGVFIRAFTLEEMFEGLRRITRLNRLFIDLHEDQRFADDL